MKELRLTPKGKHSMPVEVEVISPDFFSGKRLQEISELPVHVGNRVEALGDHFEIEGEVAEKAVEQAIVVEGNVPWAKYVGTNMTGGRIVVKGDAGMHTGAQMSGGELLVEGSVSDWAGAEMKGGLLRIGGNAGDLLGAAYRGSKDGMTGGCIVVGGNVGAESGAFIRRGMMVSLGGVGPFAGVHMNGGEMFVFGRASKRLGAQMTGNGGIIVCFGEIEELLPTFTYDATYKPNFMRLHIKVLHEKLGIKHAHRFMDAPFKRFRGDGAVGGNGEIIVADI